MEDDGGEERIASVKETNEEDGNEACNGSIDEQVHQPVSKSKRKRKKKKKTKTENSREVVATENQIVRIDHNLNHCLRCLKLIFHNYSMFQNRSSC